MSAKKGLGRSLEKVKSKRKGILKCFSRDPLVTPLSVIEMNSRNVYNSSRSRNKQKINKRSLRGGETIPTNLEYERTKSSR